MELVPQNFAMRSGEDKTLTVTVTDAAEAAVDINGAQSIEWRLADGVGAASAHVTKTLGAGVAIGDGAAGIFVVTLVPADTEPLAGRFHHEARLVNAAGKRQTVLVGSATIHRNLVP
jgi:hypothetical protein